MFENHVDSRMMARQLFSLFVGLSFIAIAVTLSVALRSRPLDYGFLTVGVAAVMVFYLTVGLFLVTLVFLGRLPFTPPQRFSDPSSQSDLLWDDQLDGVPIVTDPSDAPIQERRRIVPAGSVRLTRGIICGVDDSRNLAERQSFRELVEKVRGVNTHGSNVSVIDLGGSDLSGADLSGADLSKADLSGARLCKADFRESDLTETVLQGADLTQADFRRADLNRANLRNAVLREAILRWVDLCGADLTGANLFGANLEGALLHETIFRGADLGLASINVKSIDGADFSEADLRGTDIRGADLGCAKGLTRAHVDSAWGDGGTILPRGLVRPRYWDKTVTE
jgi:uncharacterized protein YjbI with pentapeptide repeats